MFTIRATQKLLKRLASKGVVERRPPTTALGDWYANLLRFGPMQLVLCTSEKSLLSVVVPARGVKSSLPEALREGVKAALVGLAVPSEAIDRELAEMSEVQLAGTLSRQVLGSMNDFAVAIEYRLHAEPNTHPSEWALWLAETPCSPLGYDSPRDVVTRLFEAGPSNKALQLTRRGSL